MDGKPCIFLKQNESGEFRWTCLLREELGSWEAVHQDERYKENVQPHWIEKGIKDCGDYSCSNCLNGNA